MNKSLALLTALLACAFLQNCAKSSGTAAAEDAQDPAVAQAKADSEASAMLLPAYALNRDAAGYARITNKNGGGDAAQAMLGISAETKLPTFSSLPATRAPGLKPKQRPLFIGTLLKAAARGLAKASAASLASSGGMDTTWLRLADSAQGHIQSIHDYALADGAVTGTAHDTLTYKWPYLPSNPTVLGQSGRRTFSDSTAVSYAVMDDDGDGILNEAAGGKPVKLLKKWITVSGDTAWKSYRQTTHGQTTFYDSLGAGSATAWKDSVFVKGKNVSWQRTLDGDGDGFIPTAAAGAKARIDRNSYLDIGDGTFLFVEEHFGPGKDGDFQTEADNEVLPFTSRLIGSDTHDIVTTTYGDGDGDGFYLDPAATGPNLAWVVNRYPGNDSVASQSDSLAQTLSAGDGSVLKLNGFASTRILKDGRSSTVSTRMPGGKAGFSGNDTVQIWDREYYSDYRSKHAEDPLAVEDSSLWVTWVVPGDLASAADDKITGWYSRVYYKHGQPKVYASRQFTPAAAFGPEDAPKAGILIDEDRINPTSSKSVIRTVRIQEFDLAAGQSTWKQTRFLENGDSAVSVGSGSPAGTGEYSADLGPGTKNMGSYDAGTGEFQDTLVFMGPTGKALAKEIAWGDVDAAHGTGDYYSKRLGGGDTATAHITVAKDGAGFKLTRKAGGRVSEIALSGDSASMQVSMEGVQRSFAWSGGAVGAKVTQQDTDMKSGTSLATGEYYFGLDLSGVGSCQRTPKGGTASEGKVQFRADGTVFLDGVKISP